MPKTELACSLLYFRHTQYPGGWRITIRNPKPTYKLINHQIAISELGGPQFSPVMRTWDELRRGAFAPPWSVGDFLKYPATVVPYLTVVDVIDVPPGFRYRFWGTGLSDVKGFDYTGRAPSDHLPEEHGRAIDLEYRMVLAECRPLAFVHDLRPRTDQASLFQECLRLPLSNDGETVTHIISYSDWQTENEKWKRFHEVQ
ncbi:MAG: hypothetical protein RIG67_17200 [Rhodospirillales bacterium]